MAIQKDRRVGKGVAAFQNIVWTTGSVGTLNVSSSFTGLNIGFTGTVSAAALNVSSTGIVRDARVTNILSAANINVSSGLVVTRPASVVTLNVSSGITVQRLTGVAALRGVTTVASGGSFVTVSAANVNSSSPVVVTGRTNIASARTIIWSVNSVVDNTSFMIVGDKATTDTVTVMWMSMN